MLLIHIKTRKGSDEKHTLAKKSGSDSAAGSTSSPSKSSRRGSLSEDLISPSPKKNPVPVKSSNKLAMMKKRDEEKDEGLKSKMPLSPTTKKISPKKEPLASSSSDKMLTPKTGVASTAVKISSKKPEVSDINSCSKALRPCWNTKRKKHNWVKNCCIFCLSMQPEHKHQSWWCREEEGQCFSFQELPQQRRAASFRLQGNPTGDTGSLSLIWQPSCSVLNHWLCVCVFFRVQRTVWRAVFLWWRGSWSPWRGKTPSPSSNAMGARWLETSARRPPTWCRVETAAPRNSKRWLTNSVKFQTRIIWYLVVSSLFSFLPLLYTVCLHLSVQYSVFVSTQAESLGTKILDEDGLLELIRTKPGKKSKYEIAAEAEVGFRICTWIMLFIKSVRHPKLFQIISTYKFYFFGFNHQLYCKLNNFVLFLEQSVKDQDSPQQGLKEHPQSPEELSVQREFHVPSHP